MDNVEEKFVSDDGVSSVPAAVTPEGGEGKKDKLKKTTTDEPKGAVDGKKVIPGQSSHSKLSQYHTDVLKASNIIT